MCWEFFGQASGLEPKLSYVGNVTAKAIMVQCPGMFPGTVLNEWYGCSYGLHLVIGKVRVAKLPRLAQCREQVRRGGTSWVTTGFKWMLNIFLLNF